ncbi:MAG TPA: hypothetical protein VNZ49_01245 [Bacteroidia bacterium]|jgi:hypothetical protein|nr:hypothetical protein [Bacteroidia bacterium]
MQYKLKIIQAETIGVVEVKENSQFNKIRADKVIVNENITARLFGRVDNIVLKKGAKLFLHGRISGAIDNKGGEIFIFKK